MAIKALSLTGWKDWKKIELFEREAKILQHLSHPSIPKYLDYFQVESDDNVDFYIVQELAFGQSLANLITQGWLPEVKTVKDIAERVLEILVYLQQFTPPVIHRDIKPQNIIYQPDTGKLLLVDFGAVRDNHHTVNLSFHLHLSTFVYWINCTIVVINSGILIGLAICFWYPVSIERCMSISPA